MSDLTVSEVLSRAADRLDKPGAWTQGAFSRNADGSADRDEDETSASDPVCWCALGALAEESGIDPLVPYSFSTAPLISAYPVLRDLVGGDVAEWNDTPGRTQAEVVAKLREAALLAERSKSGEESRG